MKGSNSDSLQKSNRYLVLNIMRRSSITTRADIAQETCLKSATITNIIADFIEAGVVKEVGFVEGKKGRRSIGITLNDDLKVIAIRLSRLDIKVGTYNLHGELEESTTIDINISLGVPSIIKTIKDSIRNRISKFKDKVISIGIVLPGPYMKSDHTILQISGFPGWEGINLETEIEQEFSMPTCVEHDGKASAFAEWWYGNHPMPHHNLVNIIAGQGNGIGLITDGNIYSGAHGTAGEFGHSTICFDGPECACGNRGCLDLYCSTIVLKNNISRGLPKHPESILYGSNNISSADISNALKQNDEFVISEVRRVSRYLGYGIVNAINVLDPDIIVIGDELASICNNVLLEEVSSVVAERVLPALASKLRIVLSNLDDSILLGAMSVGLEKAFMDMKFMNR